MNLSRKEKKCKNIFHEISLGILSVSIHKHNKAKLNFEGGVGGIGKKSIY